MSAPPSRSAFLI
jgi:hypothetical protein